MKGQTTDDQRNEERPLVLVVDDTPENIDVLLGMLEADYRLKVATNGERAITLATTGELPELILLDIMMPGMDGFETCNRIKAAPEMQNTPVIFISALSETENKIKAFHAGGTDYVTKPFESEEVLARVRTHIELTRLRRELEEKNKRLEQSLAHQRELEHVKERLVQMIVHDLNNPLAAIIGNNHYVLDELPKGSDHADALRDVADSAQNMQRMVLNILDVMKLENRKLQPRRTSVDLARLVDSAVDTMRPTAQKTGHAIEVRAQPDMPRFALDRDLVRRIVENLLANSLKYAPRDTSLVVKLGVSSQGEAVIDMSDEGAGVPADMRERVFEVYERLDRDEDVAVRKSRGLGLAFCKMAVDAHGGRIWIEDNNPSGAVFRIRIPSTPQREARLEERSDG